MKTSAKLSRPERRAAIIKAVRRLFAEKGFHGTTTRELAEAAGVSEALLFKHFPTKEALYAAMEHACCAEQTSGLLEKLKALEPSTATLAILVHLFVSRMLAAQEAEDEEALQTRLMVRSLTEDGEFARLFLQGRPSYLMRKLDVCLKAAIAAGDAAPGPVRTDLAAWFGQHLSAMLRILLLSEKPAVDYGLPRDQLIEQVVWFILRGMGLKQAAIQRYYNPKALAVLTSS
jgi:AcrR family transcriptional regulator